MARLVSTRDPVPYTVTPPVALPIQPIPPASYPPGVTPPPSNGGGGWIGGDWTDDASGEPVLQYMGEDPLGTYWYMWTNTDSTGAFGNDIFSSSWPPTE